MGDESNNSDHRLKREMSSRWTVTLPFGHDYSGESDTGKGVEETSLEMTNAAIVRESVSKKAALKDLNIDAMNKTTGKLQTAEGIMELYSLHPELVEYENEALPHF